MQLMLISNDPQLAALAETCGVTRIFLDMESKGKLERQVGQNMPLNTHSFEDIKRVRAATKSIEIMLRINPMHAESKNEIDQAIDYGVDCIMLPYFSTPEEVTNFIQLVGGRVKTNLLLETAAAAGRAEQILSIPGINEVHFGLNDLKLSLGHDFLFESLAGGLIDFLCNIAKQKNISYGIGGIGRVGHGDVPAEVVIKEYVRLHSQRVILSRIFRQSPETFSEAIQALRHAEELAHKRSLQEVLRDQMEFKNRIHLITKSLRLQRSQAATCN